MDISENLKSPVDLLVDSGRINADVLARATRLAAETREPIPATLTRLGMVSEQDMAKAFSQALNLIILDADDLSRIGSILEPVPNAAFLRQARVLPLQALILPLQALTEHDQKESIINLAMADPTNEIAVKGIELFFGKPVRRVIVLPTDLDATLDRLLAEPHERDGKLLEFSSTADIELSDLDRLRESISDAPVIRIVNALLARAVDERASDLHLEPTADALDVRLRVDGKLRLLQPSIAAYLRDPVISRVKLMAGLDIAERRLPQDGRIAHAVRGTEVDFRVATAPMAHGESVVIRVLDRSQVRLDFTQLGFDNVAMAALSPQLALPHGMLLVTGPTGSGKTTTLYAALSVLNAPERKLMTIEDPIEYQLSGVQQVQVQPNIGLTFERALRAFLRHNPNIVMIGEIRDLETAQVAVQVALTGHLVLSTLHTNDAASGITRLLDMGVEDYLIASTLNAIVAQRLVRTLCKHCIEPYQISAELAGRMGIVCDSPITLYTGVGCRECGSSGFSGRSTILEVLPITEKIRALILARASSSTIARAAIDEGMRTMQTHGMQKALSGLTTVDEVLAATRAT